MVRLWSIVSVVVSRMMKELSFVISVAVILLAPKGIIQRKGMNNVKINVKTNARAIPKRMRFFGE